MIIGIIKSIFLMIILYFLIKLIGYFFRFFFYLSNKRNNEEVKDADTLKMLQCESCKVYILKSEAYIHNGKIFCKKEHSDNN